MAVTINGSAGVTTNSGAVYDSLQRATAKTAVTDFTTSADFTSIPTWVRRITVMFDGVSLSGTDDFLIQIGDSGGLEITGYLSATSVGGATTIATSNSTSGFLFIGGAATRLFGGAIVLTNLSGNIWVCNGGIADSSSARTIFAFGSKTLSAQLDRVSVTRTGTNTFDAGTINILYE